MWETRGAVNHISEPILVKFSEKLTWRDILSLSERAFSEDKYKWAKKAVRFTSKSNVDASFRGAYNLPAETLKEIRPGDILEVFPNGRITKAWELSSSQNVLYITDACNSNCVMCPQPRLGVDRSEEALKILSMLSADEVQTVCISGGEPTLGKRIFQILDMLKEKRPNQVIMLTNGRKFKDKDFAKRIIEVAPNNMVYGIPLYSSVPYIHDAVVGSDGAFNETITGIYNLTEFFRPIELRIVLTRQTVQGLVNLANFIGWNLPMVIHVALMGMEVHGNAQKNEDKVWIEPQEYMDLLLQAVRELVRRNIFVSIYNLPLCLLPNSLWKFSVKSISDWKKGYQKECSLCSKKSECAGFFTTSDIVPLGIKHFT